MAAIHQTKTELALSLLREGIRSGRLKPGERLLIKALEEQLKMSPTPIREALRQLQADRLVDMRPHHGVVVAEVSDTDTEEIIRLRATLEPLAVERAATRMTPETLVAIDNLHARIRAAVSAGRAATLSKLNAEWHWLIYDACESQLLLEFIRRLWDTFQWRTLWAVPGRSDESVEQHEAILNALRASKPRPREAAAAMRAHVLTAGETLLGRHITG
jgi:DNA-binding GntR family transcriptional regulator